MPRVHPFPFLGDSATTAPSVRVWALAVDNPVERVKGAKVRADGRVTELSWAKAPQDLAAALTAVHAQTPLLLVVNSERTRTVTAWGAASVGDDRVLPALEALASSSPSYSGLTLPLRGSRDVSVQLFKAIAGRAPRAELIAATMRALLDASPGKSRAPLRARLEDSLARCAGFEFAIDVVIQNVLGQLRKFPANTVAMSEAYQLELQRHMKAVLAVTGRRAAIDWSVRHDVLAAMTAGRWDALASSLREGVDAHVETVLSLEPEALLALSTNGHGQPTRLANIATTLIPLVGSATSAVPSGLLYALPVQRWAQVLRLFDAAIEGALDPRAAANPLFAVQDDFHHQGVFVERARRYLERCLPHGEQNVAVFLNAAGVFMELGEPGRALECLVAAKRGGAHVRALRNEKLFAPLRGDPRFEDVMKPLAPGGR